MEEQMNKKTLGLLCLLAVCAVWAVIIFMAPMPTGRPGEETSDIPISEAGSGLIYKSKHKEFILDTGGHEYSNYLSSTLIFDKDVIINYNELGKISGYSVLMAEAPADALYKPGMMTKIYLKIPEGEDPNNYKSKFTEGQLNAFRRAVGAPEVLTDTDTELVLEEGMTVSCMYRVGDLYNTITYKAGMLYIEDGPAEIEFYAVNDFTEKFKSKLDEEMRLFSTLQ